MERITDWLKGMGASEVIADKSSVKVRTPKPVSHGHHDTGKYYLRESVAHLCVVLLQVAMYIAELCRKFCRWCRNVFVEKQIFRTSFLSYG